MGKNRGGPDSSLYGKEMADALWTLSSLTTGRPGLTPGEAQSLMEAAAVCLADQGHGRLVQLRLTGEFQHTVELALPPVDEPMRRTHADLPRAVERGACAIAALVCERQQGLVVAEQSCQMARRAAASTTGWHLPTTTNRSSSLDPGWKSLVFSRGARLK